MLRTEVDTANSRVSERELGQARDVALSCHGTQLLFTLTTTLEKGAL